MRARLFSRQLRTSILLLLSKIMNTTRVSRLLTLIVLISSSIFVLAQSTPIGIFDGHGDVGENPKAGSATYDAATGEYRVTGGGANIWAAVDAFHFLYKKMTGDVTLTADVKFEGAGVNPHRKAVLMVRQSLDANSAYADVARHGSGLTSLQYRPTAEAQTMEVQSKDDAPDTHTAGATRRRVHHVYRQARNHLEGQWLREGDAGGSRICWDWRLLARCQCSGDGRVFQRED